MNQVVQIRGGKNGTVGGHGGFAAKFLQIAQFALAEAVKAALLVFELDCEAVFIEANAANGLAGRSGGLHEKEFFRDGFCRILQSLAKARRAAARAGVGKFWAVA